MNEPVEDPAVRDDGLCAVCLGPRMPKPLKPVYQGEAGRDPFCSASCARSWHGVPLLEPQARPRKAYVSKLP